MAATSDTKDAEAGRPRPASQTLPQPLEARAMIHNLIEAGLRRLPSLPNTIEEIEMHIPVTDGWQSSTVVVRPKAHVTASRPLIVLFYGGGFMVGEPKQLLAPARAYAEKFGAVVVLPSYRLSPEATWPVPFNDGWDISVWLSKHAEAELGANLAAGFVIGGSSAGGTIAAAIGGLYMYPDSQEAREVPGLARPLTGLFVCIPWLVVEQTVPDSLKPGFTSREDNYMSEGFNTVGLQLVMDRLKCTNYSSLWFSPVCALVKAAPSCKVPVFIDHGQFDTLRDDAKIFDKLLQARGVKTKLVFYPHDGHAAWTTMGLPSKAKDPTIEEAQLEGMGWILTEGSRSQISDRDKKTHFEA